MVNLAVRWNTAMPLSVYDALLTCTFGSESQEPNEHRIMIGGFCSAEMMGVGETPAEGA